MPLIRYFTCVGGVLLALLFVVNWSLPPLSAEPERAGADRSAIRIHSQHKWPVAVVFDTTLPTIALPPAPVAAQSAAATLPVEPKSPHDALALAQNADVTAAVTAPPARARHAKRRVKTQHSPREYVARYDSFAFRPLFATGW